MKIAFVINDINTEDANYTTVNLAKKAHEMGHSIYMIDVGHLSYAYDGLMGAKARTVEDKKYKSSGTFFNALKQSSLKYITAADLDVLFLRNNPADEIGEREWAQNAAYVFGEIAVKNGVIVLNHPATLSTAINKMYFQHFPEILRPKTIITRDQKEIEDFFEDQKGKIILKPLQGSGGTNVFMVDRKSKKNLNQIIEAISRDGYVIAQEYLTEATEGDTRLFIMNGSPLTVDGKFAAIRRVNESEDIRSNVHAGGRPKPAKISKEVLTLIDVLRPKLQKDGMFLVGVDIVGTKLMEINVFSPGGLNMMSNNYKVDFLKEVILAIEAKVKYKSIYGNDLSNIHLASL
jgi:glutathione synthase